MKKINLEIKALSPLVIGRQKPGGNVSEVEQYIPGSVIRGAVASQILKRTNQSISDDDDFHQLFLGDNPAIFQNAYPGIITIDSDCVFKPNVQVLPATVLSSKSKSGFQTGESEKNGVFDTLIDRFCAEKYAQIYDPNCPTEHSTYGERVDHFSGFYSEHDDDYYTPAANDRLLTRVGINRRRATSEERVLYSIAVLNESQENKKRPVTYTGVVLINDDLAVPLQQFIQNHQDDLRLGGAGSRGLGKVKITAKAPTDIKSTVIHRIDEFNQKLRQRWSEWGKIFGNPLEILPENRTYFTVDLQADAILTEQWQRTTVISPAMLQQYTGVSDLSLHIHAAYSSYDYRSGWNTAWGLMKDVELVTNKGSVYLFSTENKNLWLQAWEDLEVYGIGDRTCEGFGQVQICNEFHLIFREEAV
ncbi:type III-D CRISPR-associated RAMP protein Csx10 [Nostoc sp. CMAA1605]|uniref:type III-D CRISPR-associated RAMP protein Csx10 n=1 Tax=Nostoc sp. CMAA1605 TaxID=2055159 RepID=UPI001F2457FC|nr:CRISPR-associated RAMP protein Csx10 [Nostoc sp. CMAA1605]MCF4965765.1 CRISPR-associated RAMP protein Csx10 [Nostoc sp. CMAA1605]